MQYWSKLANRISPYVPGEQPRRPMVKLNTNENPYPPSPKAIAAMQQALSEKLRLYPDPTALSLRNAIARVEQVPPEAVFVGNGSDEVLALCFLAFCDADTPVRFCDVTYSFYPVYAALYGMQTRILPLKEDFTLPVEALCRDEGPVLVANPNAPTSLAVGRDVIRTIAQCNRSSAVIVDEAYVAFGAETAVPLTKELSNLLVVRTFSKSHSLAGLRVGYAIGDPKLVEALWRVKDSFNSYPLDRVAQAGAEAAILDTDYLEQTRRAIMDTRETTKAALCRMGCTCADSRSNFLFVRPPKGNAAELLTRLRERDILVRHFNQPRIAEYLRITVGTPAEMELFLQAMQSLLD